MLLTVPEMCTGVYHESGKTPIPGTKCVEDCVNQEGEWGSSWCYTNEEKTQWGAECIECPGKIDFV